MGLDIRPVNSRLARYDRRHAARHLAPDGCHRLTPPKEIDPVSDLLRLPLATGYRPQDGPVPKAHPADHAKPMRRN